MITIPLFEASIAVGGIPNQFISPMDYILSVTQRSSEVALGALFVALRGNRVDGHDFVKEAQQKGAVAAIVEYLVEGVTIPQIIVPSTEVALGDLARIWRSKLQLPLVAVTGSVGKTTTKELIAHVLQKNYHTHKSRKNYNNQLGVPIELLRLERDHQVSVVELGMRDLNQINYLAKIARPNFGVITNIGISHIGILKTRDNIAKAKAEIFQGMDSGSIALLNRDDAFYDTLVDLAPCRVISYGMHPQSDICISEITLIDSMFPSFKINGVSITMNHCTGEYNAYNAAIAFAIAECMGVSQEDIVSQVASFVQPERRGVSIRLRNGALLLDSTYNAAPDSIVANLKTIAQRKQEKHRLIFVIGDMLELGSYSKEAHEQVGNTVAQLGNKVDLLITIGEYTKGTSEVSKVGNRHHFEDAQQATEFIQEHITPYDLILFQGSNQMNLGGIVDDLEKCFGIA